MLDSNGQLKMLIDKDYTVAIVPAKLTSKRLPKKNILKIGGQPLFIYSVMAGINSEGINDTYVTSESELILQEALKYGVNIILRPEKLSTPEISNYYVIQKQYI